MPRLPFWVGVQTMRDRAIATSETRKKQASLGLLLTV